MPIGGQLPDSGRALSLVVLNSSRSSGNSSSSGCGSSVLITVFLVSGGFGVEILADHLSIGVRCSDRRSSRKCSNKSAWPNPPPFCRSPVCLQTVLEHRLPRLPHGPYRVPQTAPPWSIGGSVANRDPMCKEHERQGEIKATMALEGRGAVWGRLKRTQESAAPKERGRWTRRES